MKKICRLGRYNSDVIFELCTIYIFAKYLGDDFKGGLERDIYGGTKLKKFLLYTWPFDIPGRQELNHKFHRH